MINVCDAPEKSNTVVNDAGDAEILAEPLGRWPILSYGTGHMLNDTTSACWFTYLLVFLTDMGLSPSEAATVMLSGQIADGFATIFAGELMDRFGRFKRWHGAGSALVTVSFSSVFGGCSPCKILGTDSPIVQTIGYSTSAAIFNVGWAATQVSHMSMVNCITLNPTSRVALASCRNAFTMVANLSLYAIAFVVFHVTASRTKADVETQYMWIAYVSIFIGCCFLGVFYIGTKEPRSNQEVEGRSDVRVSWAYWFKKVLYYQVAVVYVLTRLITNVSQSFLAFYVIDDLQMSPSSKALVPAIIYISSFIISILLQEMKWNGHRLKLFFSAGGILWICCGAGTLLLPRNMSAIMYLLSIVIGMANALIMVTAISMQSVLVGEDLNGCAFVYGSLSFMDKMACGLALYILESYQNTTWSLGICGCFTVTRNAVGFIPAVCAALGVIVTSTMDLNTTRKPLSQPLLA
ncbi:hypothetical protein NMG60_11023291 [Bertholletia excelsa]